MDKELSEDKNISAIIAGINRHEEEQNKALLQQKIEIEKLRKEFESIKICNNNTPETLNTLGILEQHNHESRDNFRKSRSPRRVYFEGQGQNQSAQGYSREIDSRSRSRSPSP